MNLLEFFFMFFFFKIDYFFSILSFNIKLLGF